MSLMTSWGYTLTDVDSLPDMLESDEFDEFTASKYKTDSRAESNLGAVGSAIRNYCGWHVYPSADCELSTTFFDKRITQVGGGVMIQLPATFVSGIDSVTIGGTEYTTYVLESNGVLRVYGIDWTDIYPYTAVVVDYVAGLPDGFVGALKELIAHQTIHALESTSGVQSETAGGVSVTYNATWINNSRGTALSDSDKEVIAPYRLRGVF